MAVLVAPGASRGGTRPKANFTEADGSLWIGKFPARDDDRDVGAWEYAVHRLATKARVDVPAAKLVRLSNDFTPFVFQRFDRDKGALRFYASAMTARTGATADEKSECVQRVLPSWLCVGDQ